MKYTYNSLEDYVTKMYQSIGIFHPHQLNFETIVAKLGLSIVFAPFESMHVGEIIFLADRLTDQQQWQVFGHELCHVLWHAGNQIRMPLPFRLYQEWKATSFALHACIPTFMLLDMNLPSMYQRAIQVIQETFCVTYEFAERRLLQYEQNRQMYLRDSCLLQEK